MKAVELELPAALTGRLGKAPIRLVDVGARGGIEPPWSAIAPMIEVVGFEPLEEAFEPLGKGAPRNATYLNVALGDTPGETILYRTRSAAGTSVFPPNAAFFDAFVKDQAFAVVSEIPCRVDTLDRALSAAGIGHVDFVKLDTQGSELSILQGAQQILERFVFGVEVEINLNEIYEGVPLFGDVDRFVRGYDYELAEIRPQWRLRYSGRGLVDGGRGQSVWGDALYLKSLPAVTARLGTLTPVERETELARHVATCLLYGLGDYALELVGAADVPEETARELTSAVHQHDRQWASQHGVQHAFVLPPDLAEQLHKQVRGRGEREKRRTPEWVVVRALRAWLKEHAPPGWGERLRALPPRLRRAVRRA